MHSTGENEILILSKVNIDQGTYMQKVRPDHITNPPYFTVAQQCYFELNFSYAKHVFFSCAPEKPYRVLYKEVNLNKFFR